MLRFVDDGPGVDETHKTSKLKHLAKMCNDLAECYYHVKLLAKAIDLFD